MSDLINGKDLYNRLAELEADVRKKLLSTPRDSEAYIRYVERLNERSFFKHEIMDAPDVEAVPKSYAEQIRWERDVAVEQLNEIGCGFGQKMDEVKEKLETLQWISCSEELPKKSGKYLVTIREGLDVHTTVRRFNPKPKHPEQNKPVFTKHVPYYSGWERATRGVVAWMPLPQPYKGE